MKNIELYKKTTDILVNAYFNDTLEHENCYACAVGNIIAANMGMKFLKMEGTTCKQTIYWENYVSYTKLNLLNNDKFPSWYSKIHSSPIDRGCAKVEIESTGYTERELAKIEKAFEGAKGNNTDEHMFNGLMAVIECLDEIHENKESSVTNSIKERFIKVLN